jgi:putative methionine-R-sulfoxide reductase with GAF domain
MATTILKMTEHSAVVSLLTTELNSLANNTNTAAGAAVTNAVGQSNLDGYTRGKVELVLAAYTGTPTANTCVKVWFLKTIDGTNYEDGSASVTPARRPDVVIPVGAIASGPQRVTVECWMPVGTFKPMARNDGTGITFAASGNTVKVLLNTDTGVS